MEGNETKETKQNFAEKNNRSGMKGGKTKVNKQAASGNMMVCLFHAYFMLSQVICSYII
jgi:hypothetical protein